jgi:hypothetical protein
MSTVFKHQDKVLWIHHETFTPTLKTPFEIDGAVYTVKAVKLTVAVEGIGAASITQLTSTVELA